LGTVKKSRGMWKIELYGSSNVPPKGKERGGLKIEGLLKREGKPSKGGRLTSQQPLRNLLSSRKKTKPGKPSIRSSREGPLDLKFKRKQRKSFPKGILRREG